MSKFDITGNKYGKLTVDEAVSDKQNNAYYKCRCGCGSEHLESRDNLIKLRIRSCGCVPKSDGSIIGKKYSMITILDGVDELASRRRPKYLCRCDCGKQFLATGADIVRGRIISCGCVVVEREDFVGMKVGELQVLSLIGISSSGISRYRCRCSCHNLCIKTGDELSKNKYISCGCKDNDSSLVSINDDYGLVGSKIDTLTVTCVESGYGPIENMRYRCICDCGNEYVIDAYSLVTGHFRRCGCKWTNDSELIGFKHDKITIVERLCPPNIENPKYKCTCECGNEFVAKRNDLRRGMLECNCNSSIAVKHKNNDNYFGEAQRLKKIELLQHGLVGYTSEIQSIIRTLYNSSVVHRSKKVIMMEYNINIQEFADLIEQPCHYCGRLGVGEAKRRTNSGTTTFGYNGLDRVDNSRGYMTDNAVSCCKRCNFAKSSQSEDEFRMWIDSVYHYHIVKDEHRLENDDTEVIDTESNERSYKILDSRYKENIVRRSKYLRKSYDVSFNEFVKLSISKCSYCGSKPSVRDEPRAAPLGGAMKFNGIDRIDNQLGYLKTNTATCCKKCNKSKNDMSYDEFKEWVSLLHKNYCHKKNPK